MQTQAGGNEVEVFLQQLALFLRCRAFRPRPNSADKLAEAVSGVITEPFLIGQRQDAIVISGEGFVGAFGRQLSKTADFGAL